MFIFGLNEELQGVRSSLSSLAGTGSDTACIKGAAVNKMNVSHSKRVGAVRGFDFINSISLRSPWCG